MMFSYRLVRLIESHADALAEGLEEKVQTSAQVAHFRNIPAHEVRERVYEIYRHLGEWLLCAGRLSRLAERDEAELRVRLSKPDCVRRACSAWASMITPAPG